MAALHTVVLLAGATVSPQAFQRQPTAFDMDVKILTLQSWQFGGDHVVVSSFVEIDRWNPAGRAR